MQNVIEIYHVGKSYGHFHELRTTNSISDFSANPRVVQFHYSLITFKKMVSTILPALRDSVAGMNVSFICVTRLSQLPDHAKVSDPAEDYILSLHQHVLIHPTACVCRLRIKEIFAKMTLAASVTNTLFELCSDVIKGWQNLLRRWSTVQQPGQSHPVTLST